MASPDLIDCVLYAAMAAGEFLDTDMKNAYLRGGEGYKHFQQYLKGIGKVLQASRWAWHAYSDGAETITNRKYRGHRKRWWHRYQNFQAAVDHAVKHARFPRPNIWPTEQGAEYFSNNAETTTHAWENGGHAEAVMNAYVKEGKYQLTNESSQITRFVLLPGARRTKVI